MRSIILIAYLAAILGVGALARRSGRGDESFFLAGRTLGPFILLATMAATNFSGFTVLGFSGAGFGFSGVGSAFSGGGCGCPSLWAMAASTSSGSSESSAACSGAQDVRQRARQATQAAMRRALFNVALPCSNGFSTCADGGDRG